MTTTKNPQWTYGGEPVTKENANDIALDLAKDSRQVSNDGYGNARWYVPPGPFGDNKPKAPHWRRARSCFRHGPGYYVQAINRADLADVIYRAIVARLNGTEGKR